MSGETLGCGVCAGVGVRGVPRTNPLIKPGEHRSPPKSQKTGVVTAIPYILMVKVATPFFRGSHPFINVRLNCEKYFDLINDSDREEVDKFLSDFTMLNHCEGSDNRLLEFMDSKNHKIVSYINVHLVCQGKGTIPQHRHQTEISVKFVIGSVNVQTYCYCPSR